MSGIGHDGRRTLSSIKRFHFSSCPWLPCTCHAPLWSEVKEKRRGCGERAMSGGGAITAHVSPGADRAYDLD